MISFRKCSVVFMLCAGMSVAADAGAGKAGYDKACRACHGPDGTPNAKIASSMKVEMRHLGSKEVQAVSDVELKQIITEGKGKMKPGKTVSGTAVDDVVAYMRTFKQ